MDEARLAKAIADAMTNEQKETGNAALSVERLSKAIAKAVVAEVKSLTITYTGGLAAGSATVTGVFRYTLG